MNKVLLLSIFFTSIVTAQEVGVDCLIVKDENSIICKYTQERSLEDRNIEVNWIDPNGKLSRQRDMVIPAGHGSVYDFRYLKGRMTGVWSFIVIDNEIKHETTFNIEKKI